MREQSQKHARKHIKVGCNLKLTLVYKGLILIFVGTSNLICCHTVFRACHTSCELFVKVLSPDMIVRHESFVTVLTPYFGYEYVAFNVLLTVHHGIV
jgi:hypothetical protein